MGRSSTSSCLKIIACGSHDSVDRDGLQAPERKDSSDRRGWSFRKRSARHRVLSNSVTSETPSGNKTSSDTASVSFQTPPSSAIQEKSSVVECTEEKTQLSTPVDLKLSEIVSEDVKTADITPDESVVIIIQAAIRGFLAQRVLLKHKNIIKLQASVRGHIVRRHAVGSLRCVQAIIKMQGLVRERRTRLLLEARTDGVDEKVGKEDYGSTVLFNEEMGTKPHVTYTSIDKLLRNGFARQLLESMPRTKTINIKCDPSKSDSAWKWLQRWMSVSSVGIEQSPGLESAPEQQDEMKLEKSDCQLGNEVLLDDSCKSGEIKYSAEALAVPSEDDENVITYDVDSFDSGACGPTLSSVSHSTGQPWSQNIGEANSTDNALDSLPDKTRESDLVSKTEHDSFKDQSEMEHEQHVHSLKRPAPEEPETDGKKFLYGSRKASNPAFVAAQSKFEELSLSANSARSVGSSNQDACVDTSSDTAFLVTERPKETAPAESSFPHTSGIEVGGSECGTELSISSTLDSPDRLIGVVNTGKETHLADVTGHPESNLKPTVDNEVESQTVERDLSDSTSVEQERHDHIPSANYDHDNSAKAVDSVQAVKKPDAIETDVLMQLESEITHQVNKSSPEESPRSLITVPESQETPSSQVSVKPRKSSSGKSGSNHKRRSDSSGKGHPSDPNHDYGARNSLEQLPKDHKSGKRRSSFGSARSDHEPRDSSSNNSLPSYMQATESARAKALANSSPRSSPDAQDKDFYMKKRRSLPGANTRQGSPRVQQSMSQAQQGAKGNGIHSPQERKWRR